MTKITISANNEKGENHYNNNNNNNNNECKYNNKRRVVDECLEESIENEYNRNIKKTYPSKNHLDENTLPDFLIKYYEWEELPSFYNLPYGLINKKNEHFFFKNKKECFNEYIKEKNTSLINIKNNDKKDHIHIKNCDNFNLNKGENDICVEEKQQEDVCIKNNHDDFVLSLIYDDIVTYFFKVQEKEMKVKGTPNNQERGNNNDQNNHDMRNVEGNIAKLSYTDQQKILKINFKKEDTITKQEFRNGDCCENAQNCNYCEKGKSCANENKCTTNDKCSGENKHVAKKECSGENKHVAKNERSGENKCVAKNECSGENKYTAKNECSGENKYTAKNECSGENKYTAKNECSGENKYTAKNECSAENKRVAKNDCSGEEVPNEINWMNDFISLTNMQILSKNSNKFKEWNNLEIVIPHIINYCCSVRSCICKNSFLTITYICKSLKEEKDILCKFFVYIFPFIIKKLDIKNNFLNKCVTNAIEEFMLHSSNMNDYEMLRLICSYSNDKNSCISKKMSYFVYLFLKNLPQKELINFRISDFASPFLDFINAKLEDTKKYIKQALQILLEYHDEDNIIDNFKVGLEKHEQNNQVHNFFLISKQIRNILRSNNTNTLRKKYATFHDFKNTKIVKNVNKPKPSSFIF
ncbi:hypothetical protein PFMG_01367 [Plasmodium falciparum IGH-CR14]|uniref:Uncharacterized protein n=1 Tax=Plasmodium falciparum IGH-CR14 TaxID=580059 RepID=A0A0L1I6U3_PLAFA|nr:hypothetical protein PFMG_01367 [Plasmodium falciparum IGH-CR14]